MYINTNTFYNNNVFFVIIVNLFFLSLFSLVNLPYLLPLLLLFDSFFLLILATKYRELFLVIFFIFYANYSISIIYFDNDLIPPFFYQISDESVYNSAIISMIIFTCVLITSFYNIRRIRIQFNDRSSLIIRQPWVEFICIGLYLLLFVTQLDFNGTERMTTTAAGEYKFLFAILGSFFAVKTESHKLLWTFVLGFTTLLTFLGGNRVDALPNLFVLYFFWYDNITTKQFVLGAIVGIFFMNIIGVFRSNIVLLFVGDISLSEVFVSLFKGKFAFDTFYHAYFPSLCSIDLYLQNWDVKFSLLVDNILYIFLGGNYGQRILPEYTRLYYVHVGGFIGPLTLNYWLGFLGPFILGCVVRFFVRKCFFYSSMLNNYSKLLVVTFMIICPRWYVYNFLSLPRTLLIISILYFFFYKLNNHFKAKKHIPSLGEMYQRFINNK